MKNHHFHSSVLALIGIISIAFTLWLTPFNAHADYIINNSYQSKNSIYQLASPIINQPYHQEHLNINRTVSCSCCEKQPITISTTDPLYFDRIFSVNSEFTYGFAILPFATGYYVVDAHGTSGGFIKFNLQGMPVYGKDLVYSVPFSVLKYMSTTSDGKYYAGGVLGTYPNVGGLLGKFDSDTSLLWLRSTVSLGVPSWIGSIESTLDDGVVALVRENQGFGVAKFDSNGTLEWKKRININASGPWATDVLGIKENYYLDAQMHEQCGGYLIYGSVLNPTSDFDIYLAAISCDGSTLHWQRTIGGSSWEGTYISSGALYSRASNIIMLTDNNAQNVQNATFAVAATTNSFGQNKSIMTIPFTVTGTTTLSNTVSIGQIKLIDGPNEDIIHGPAIGMNLLKLSDGNILIGGQTYSYGNGDADIFLMKMNPSFSPIWQYTYGTSGYETATGFSETGNGIQVTGTGESGIFLSLPSDGENQGLCIERQTSNLEVTNIATTILTPTYTLDAGTLNISTDSLSQIDATAVVSCPKFLFVPLIFR